MNDHSSIIESPTEQVSGIRLRVVNYILIGVVCLLSLLLLYIALKVGRTETLVQKYTDDYMECSQAANDMQAGSDYLMRQVRSFAVTGKLEFVDLYFEEAEVLRRRDQAVETLKEYLEGSDTYQHLSEALSASNDLMRTECYSIRLACEAFQYDFSSYSDYIKSVELSAEDLELSPQQMQDKAIDLVFSQEYLTQKAAIDQNISLCSEELIRITREQEESAMGLLQRLLTTQRIFLLLLLVTILFAFILFFRSVLRPIEISNDYIRQEQALPLRGAYEFKYLAQTYNQMFQQSRLNRNRLAYEASHDALTGVLNRGAFEKIRSIVEKRKCALFLIDVDYFKTINDTYGHTVGDQILQKVARILSESFRTEDSIFRIGGDEFAILMVHADPSLTELIRGKILSIIQQLQHPEDGLPPVSLSVGVAFSDRKSLTGDLYKDADSALYRIKEAGRANIAFFEE